MNASIALNMQTNIGINCKRSMFQMFRVILVFTNIWLIIVFVFIRDEIRSEKQCFVLYVCLFFIIGKGGTLTQKQGFPVKKTRRIVFLKLFLEASPRSSKSRVFVFFSHVFICFSVSSYWQRGDPYSKTKFSYKIPSRMLFLKLFLEASPRSSRSRDSVLENLYFFVFIMLLYVLITGKERTLTQKRCFPVKYQVKLCF